jgi:UDP-glucose 4-epimerase
MTRAVVLGGSGFIGRPLVKYLAGQGQQVSVYSRLSDPGLPRSKGVQYVRGDFVTGERLTEALAGADHCYHLISTTIPSSSSGDPLFDIETNLKPTVRLLELSRSLGVKKIIFCSSGGTVYGISKHTPIGEEHPLWPITPYGIVKAAIEKYLNMYFALYDLNYAIVRLSNPFGEGQRNKLQGAVTVFIDHALRDEEIEIWGDGTVTRDFIYITDAVRGLATVAAHDSANRTFNIGSGAGCSLNELLKIIESTIGRKLRVKFLPSRSFDVPINVLSIARAKQELGWSPGISLVEGIQRTATWLRTEMGTRR